MDDHTIQALRAHIADYENKVSDISLEQFRQKKSVESKKNELKYVNDETECLYSATKNVFKKIEEASEALRKQQNHILILQTDSVSLAQALDLLKNENVKRKTALNEMKIAHKKCLDDLVRKSQEHQDYYDSLEIMKKIRELDSMNTSQLPTLDSNSEAKEKSVALEQELDSLEKSCQKIRHQIEETEMYLKHSESHEFQGMEFDELELRVQEIEDEKNKEEDYIKSLQSNLNQIAALKQLVKCNSCGHSYLVGLKKENTQETADMVYKAMQ